MVVDLHHSSEDIYSLHATQEINKVSQVLEIHGLSPKGLT